MKISVIVPVYNVEKYLRECLDSIVNQTHRDLEILLVNDGSTDKSGEICDEYEEQDHRIQVFHQTNAGVSVARNSGILKSKCDYITFVDSDDWLELTMYEKIVEKITNNLDLDVVMCDYCHVHGVEKQTMARNIRAGLYTKKHIEEQIYPTLLVTENFGAIPVLSACVCIIRRSIIVNNGVAFDPDLKIGEDYLFSPSYMIYVKAFYYLKGESLYNYRQFKNSRSKSYKAEWWRNFIDLNEKLKSILKNNEDFNFTRQIKLQLIHSALLVLDRVVNDKILSAADQKSEIKKIMNDRHLVAAFSDFKIKTDLLGLRVILYLMKYKMAYGYIIYGILTSKKK